MNHSLVLKKLIYSLGTTAFSSLITILMTIIVPKIFSVADYGYWQYFVMLTFFYGLMHFGLISGMYVKYGGKSSNDLNKALYASQFRVLLVIELASSAVLTVASLFFIKDSDKQFICIAFCIAFVFSNIKQFSQYFYLTTDQIKKYSLYNTLERVFYLICVIIILSAGFTNYKYLVLCEIATQFTAAVFYIVSTKDYIFQKRIPTAKCLRETRENLSIGVKITLADVAATATVTLPRIFIENHWDIETYGKISLALSAASITIVFANAVSVVLFPILRKSNAQNYEGIFSFIRTILMTVLFASYILYYPLKIILQYWLPYYADSLKYMIILLPVCVFNAKYSILLLTYFKALRLENKFFIIEAIFFIINTAFSVLSIVLFGNLTITLLSLMLVVMLKASMSEYIISLKLHFKIKASLFSELFLTVVFVTSFWFMDSWLCFFINLIVYSLYFFTVCKIKVGRLNLLSKKPLSTDIRYDSESAYFSLLKYQLIRIMVILKYRKTENGEISELINHLKKDYTPNALPFDFTDKYKNYATEIFKDSDSGLFYVFHKGKKMYFKRSLNTEKLALDYYTQILIEQDDASPHLYHFDNYNTHSAKVIFDIGAAEGFFALEHMDSADEIHIFECDSEWIEALNYTFKPYKEKIRIIQKYVADTDDEFTVSLDSYTKENGIVDSVDLIKMDIEGAEIRALDGATILKDNKSTKWLICAYHNQRDEVSIKSHFNSRIVAPTHGYMLFFYDFNLSNPYLRRGVLRIT